MRKVYLKERDLKADVKLLLNEKDIGWFMPVPVGYSNNAVDFICNVSGHYLAIETKVKNNKPTVQQWDFLIDTLDKGGSAIVAYDLETVREAIEVIRNGYVCVGKLVQQEIERRKQNEVG